jgi:hypothetical protein
MLRYANSSAEKAALPLADSLPDLFQTSAAAISRKDHGSPVVRIISSRLPLSFAARLDASMKNSKLLRLDPRQFQGG